MTRCLNGGNSGSLPLDLVLLRIIGGRFSASDSIDASLPDLSNSFSDLAAVEAIAALVVSVAVAGRAVCCA